MATGWRRIQGAGSVDIPPALLAGGVEAPPPEIQALLNWLGTSRPLNLYPPSPNFGWELSRTALDRAVKAPVVSIEP